VSKIQAKEKIELTGDGLDVSLDHRRQQRCLFAKVSVHGHLGHAGAFSDRIHRRPRNPAHNNALAASRIACCLFKWSGRRRMGSTDFTESLLRISGPFPCLRKEARRVPSPNCLPHHRRSAAPQNRILESMKCPAAIKRRGGRSFELRAGGIGCPVFIYASRISSARSRATCPVQLATVFKHRKKGISYVSLCEKKASWNFKST
jgi:hypothetical protein